MNAEMMRNEGIKAERMKAQKGRDEVIRMRGEG